MPKAASRPQVVLSVEQLKRLLITLFAFIIGGCGERVTGPAVADFSVRGHVLDFRTDTPFAGAAVQFSSESQTGGGEATTDASGFYVAALPMAGFYTARVNGASVGRMHVPAPAYRAGFAYRGDLFVDSGSCVSRYGTIANAQSGRPVAGATVLLSGHRVTTGRDGWYRIDLGCDVVTGFGTTFINVEHLDYARRQVVVGRGVQRVARLDVNLEPR